MLRLFVEAILAAPYDQCQAGQPVALQVTLRDLLAVRTGARSARPRGPAWAKAPANKGGTGVYIPC